jgi:hypothetical protein
MLNVCIYMNKYTYAHMCLYTCLYICMYLRMTVKNEDIVYRYHMSTQMENYIQMYTDMYMTVFLYMYMDIKICRYVYIH